VLQMQREGDIGWSIRRRLQKSSLLGHLDVRPLGVFIFSILLRETVGGGGGRARSNYYTDP